MREDPDAAGLLYAGTEFGFFVSLDNGGSWRSLQQNLPATPVTDMRVHRGDLVIATMGRAFWMMDDVSPLRQMAAARSTATTPTLLQPASRVRYRAAGGGRRGGGPEYPPTALALDYLLPEGFNGPLALEISDAKGRVVRTVSPAAGRGGGGGRGQAPAVAQAADPDDPDMRLAGRGRGAAAGLTLKPGHNRFMWDYRWSSGGPLAAPGKYTAKLASGDVVETKSFEVTVDPGVLKDGVTVADLVGQQDFLLALRDTIGEATLTRERIEQAMAKVNVQPPPAPGPGESISARRTTHPLQALWARLVTARGTYEQPMLLDQFNSISRVESGADQKIGAESRRRYEDLVKEMKAIEGELEKVAGR